MFLVLYIKVTTLNFIQLYVFNLFDQTLIYKADRISRKVKRGRNYLAEMTVRKREMGKEGQLKGGWGMTEIEVLRDK